MPPVDERNEMRSGVEREIEAILFASDEPISLRRLSSLLDISSTPALREGIESLNRFYREHARSFEIVEIAGGYQMTTLPEFAETVTKLLGSKRKTRLSKPALETLAIIAYKQPISRLDIEQIRGVSCDAVLSTLMDRELIEVAGRGEGIGKPYLYATTKKFLEYLGLKDHRDLPSMEELERSLELTEPVPRSFFQDEDREAEGGDASGGGAIPREEGNSGESDNE
jgi:segregation and condensation protein B